MQQYFYTKIFFGTDSLKCRIGVHLSVNSVNLLIAKKAIDFMKHNTVLSCSHSLCQNVALLRVL
jgi:hypothetical protein